jgi:hypothetical protein
LERTRLSLSATPSADYLRLGAAHPADIRPHHQDGEQREDNSEPVFHFIKPSIS